jgi:hypothetical protein
MLILLFLSFLKYSDKITKQVYFLHFNNNFIRNRIVFKYFFKSKIVLALNKFKQYFLNFNKIHKKMNVFPFLKFKISATHPKYRLYLEQAGIARKHLKRRFYRRAGRFFLVYSGLSFLYYYICTHYLIFSNYTYNSFYYSFFLDYFHNLFFYSFSNNVSVFLLIIILFAKLGFGIFEFRFFTIIPLFDNSLNSLYFSFKISAVSLLIKFIDHFQITIFNQVNLQYNLLEYCKINEQLKNFHELIKLASLKINFDDFKIINNTELVFSYFDCYLIKHYFIHYLSFIFLFVSLFKVINFFYSADRFFNFSLTFRVTLKNDIRWALFKGNILHYFILSISLFNPVFSNISIMFFTLFYCFMVTILVILLDIFTDQSIPIYLILRRYKYYFNALPCEYYLKYPFLSLFFIFILSILGLNFPYLGLFSKIYLISDNYFICNFLILLMYLFALKRYSSKIILHDFLLQFFNTLFPAYKRIKDLYFYVFEYYFCIFISKNKLNYINLNFLVFILKNLYILLVLLLFLL